MLLLIVFSSLACLQAAVHGLNNCTVPEAVTNLRAHNTTSTTTLLTWDPPASTACLDHYRLRHCSFLDVMDTQCVFKAVTLPLNATSYEVEQLEPCRDNLIWLHSVGAGGENQAGLLVHTGSGDPPRVDRFSVSEVNATYIVLDWDLPVGYNENCCPGFRVCYLAEGEEREICSYTNKNTISTENMALLSPCTEYNVSVVTIDGSFATDSKTSAKSLLSVVTAPQMPSIVATEVRNQTAGLSWREPDALSMSCATGYQVTNCRYPDTFLPLACDVVWSEDLPPNSTSATVSGLGGCRSNHVSVSLVGRNGYSTSSQAVVQDRDTEIPVPSIISVIPTTSLLDIYYEVLPDCVTAYSICWGMEDRAETCRNTSKSYGTTFRGLSLDPCSNYTLNVTAFGWNGKSSRNFTTTFSTGPDSAPSLSVQQLTPHSALLTWGSSPSAQKCGLSYDIHVYGHISGNARIQVPINDTSYNITGLNACTQYIASFYTRSFGVSSSDTTEIVFRTQLGELQPIKQDLTFDYINSDMILMTFVGIPSNEWDCISTYITCWREVAVPQEHQECSSTTTWDTTALKACVNYTFVANVTTNSQQTVSGSTTFMLGPKKVTNVKVVEDAGSRIVNVSWTNPHNNGLCTEYIQVTTARDDLTRFLW
ncbi:fibronectin-like [Bacillus rossius redtenbacheri]|uniref:fibronectin-like n=1 Tax=Bacillus rossius redtenbacheri TaxID=93214 RepID=UPI002FDE15F7